MKPMIPRSLQGGALALVLSLASLPALATEVLPSWNDGPAKAAIVAFVDKVTKQGSPEFVPEPERVATFDNDGTLWAEQPMYVQLFFALGLKWFPVGGWGDGALVNKVGPVLTLMLPQLAVVARLMRGSMIDFGSLSGGYPSQPA